MDEDSSVKDGKKGSLDNELNKIWLEQTGRIRQEEGISSGKGFAVGLIIALVTFLVVAYFICKWLGWF